MGTGHREKSKDLRSKPQDFLHNPAQPAPDTLFPRECLNFFLIDVIEIYSLVLVKVYTLPSVAKQSVGVIFTGVKIMVS